MPPLFDYPNHLARANMLTRYAGDGFLAAHYAVTNFLLPNVLSDLVLIGLMHLVDADSAGRLLIGLIFVLTITGVAALSRVATGRVDVCAAASSESQGRQVAPAGRQCRRLSRWR